MDFTIVHGFFADMGGFVLSASDLHEPIPLDSMQLLYMVQHKHVDYPRILTADINDKSKADGLARLDPMRCPLTGHSLTDYRLLSIF